MVDVDVPKASTSAALSSLGSPVRKGKKGSIAVSNHQQQQQSHQQHLGVRQQLLFEKGLSSPSAKPPLNNSIPPNSNNIVTGDVKGNNCGTSSPFSQLGVISPGSALSISPGAFGFSPISGKTPNSKGENEIDVFSPSMFSPSSFKSSKALKKRDLIGGSSGADGIAELQMNDGGKHSHSQPSSARPSATDYLEISNLILPPIYDPFAKTYDEGFYADDSEYENMNAEEKAASSRKRQAELAGRLNLDRMDEFLLSSTGTNPHMNLLDDLGNFVGPLQVPGSITELELNEIEKSNSKRLKSTAKSPARGHHQYYSSPATILRPSEQFMSPDMVHGSNKAGCNCKRSKCLKLYCECFKAQQYCSDCDCIDCNNTSAYEEIRQDAIRTTKERNSTAFQPKVIMKDKNAEHNAGCNCKKSRCVKKYCECFEGSVHCSTNCKCINCLNDGTYDIVKDKGKGKGKGKGRNNTSTSSPMTPRKPITEGDRGEEDASVETDDAMVVDSQNEMKTHTYTKKSSSHLSSLNKHTDGEIVYSEDNENEARTSNSTSAAIEIKAAATAARSSSDGKHYNSRSNNGSSSSNKRPTPLKNRKVKFATPQEPVYEFFGPKNLHTTKLTALRCLDFLEDKDIITMSQVNKLWSIAAMDDALWE